MALYEEVIEPASSADRTKGLAQEVNPFMLCSFGSLFSLADIFAVGSVIHQP